MQMVWQSPGQLPNSISVVALTLIQAFFQRATTFTAYNDVKGSQLVCACSCQNPEHLRKHPCRGSRSEKILSHSSWRRPRSVSGAASSPTRSANTATKYAMPKNCGRACRSLSQSLQHNLLRFFADNFLQMLRTHKTLGIEFVNILRTGRPRRKPPLVRNHFQSANRRPIRSCLPARNRITCKRSRFHIARR